MGGCLSKGTEFETLCKAEKINGQSSQPTCGQQAHEQQQPIKDIAASAAAHETQIEGKSEERAQPHVLPQPSAAEQEAAGIPAERPATPEACAPAVRSASPFAAAADPQTLQPLTAPQKIDGESKKNDQPRLFGYLDVPTWEDNQPFRGPLTLDKSAERTRVHALKRLGFSYTAQESSLDFITRLVTNVFNVPVAVMGLIDGSKYYVKSEVGFGRVEALDRRLAISTWVLIPLNPEVLVVEDLSVDERFKNHPLVCKPPHLRFWAGAPLLDASGQRVGVLSVQDFKPRKMDAESCNVLCNFAEMLMREVQRISEQNVQRSMSLNPTPENEQLLRSIDACSDGVVLLDARVPRWPILFSNEGWTQVTGLSPVSGSLKCFWDMFQLPGVSSSRHPWQVYDEAVERSATFQLDVILAGSSGKQLFPVTFKPATEALDEGMVGIKVPARHNVSAPPANNPRLFYFGTILRGEKAEKMMSLGSAASLRQINGLSKEDDANQPPIPGVRLGPLLGRGSFGSVHYGTWNGAQIAVKVIHHMATEEERVARDEQLEAILGLKMLHPNIVRTFQFATKDHSVRLLSNAEAKTPADAQLLSSPKSHGREEEVRSVARAHKLQGSRPSSVPESARLELNGIVPAVHAVASGQRKMMETWIVLELCNRGSLQEAIDKGAFRQKNGEHAGSPNMINILRTAVEITGAMSYLHSLDILHSDLNGNNILLVSNTGIDDRPFSVKVSDFGLSRIHIGERTVATQTYGTVTHMPPELLSEGRLSKAADVYAFGVLLWEMYTGQRPWAGLRHVQVITHKMRNGTQLKWPPQIFAPFKEIAQRCMHPDPHQRPTFAEALELLEPMRKLAERGELQRLESANGRLDEDARKQMGALLGSVKVIVEEDEASHGSAGERVAQSSSGRHLAVHVRDT